MYRTGRDAPCNGMFVRSDDELDPVECESTLEVVPADGDLVGIQDRSVLALRLCDRSEVNPASSLWTTPAGLETDHARSLRDEVTCRLSERASDGPVVRSGGAVEQRRLDERQLEDRAQSRETVLLCRGQNAV